MTKPSIQHFAAQLLAARKRKGISQRALGERIGFPQSHISKIENGAVDLTTSSLIEMARALELEIMLVPRQLVPAVDTLINSSIRAGEISATPQPAYRLDDDDSNG